MINNKNKIIIKKRKMIKRIKRIKRKKRLDKKVNNKINSHNKN